MDGNEMLEVYAKTLAFVGLALSVHTLFFDIRFLWPAFSLIWAGVGTHAILWLIDMNGSYTEQSEG